MMDLSKEIALLALDVDGILTDGRIMLDSEGREIKAFFAQDGMGIKAALRAGLVVALVTSRNSKAVQIRARELGIEEVYLGVSNKIEVIYNLSEKYSISLEKICYMGDDLIDLQPIVEAGWGVTVPQAPDEVRSRADYITQRSSGNGAVREVIEKILKYNKSWDGLIKGYLGEA